MKGQLVIGIVLTLLGLAVFGYGIYTMAGSLATGLVTAIAGFIVAFLGAIIGLRAYNNPFD